jgi:hypothetical protein
MKKKFKTQERLEAKVLHAHDGKINLEALWREDEEMDPKRVEALTRQAVT